MNCGCLFVCSVCLFVFGVFVCGFGIFWLCFGLGFVFILFYLFLFWRGVLFFTAAFTYPKGSDYLQLADDMKETNFGMYNLHGNFKSLISFQFRC